MKNIVNNYSSIEQLTNQYLNKQKSTDKKINGKTYGIYKFDFSG